MKARANGEGRGVARGMSRVGLDRVRCRQPALMPNLRAQREHRKDEVADVQASGEVGVRLVYCVRTARLGEFENRGFDLRRKAAMNEGEVDTGKYGEVVH